MERNISNQEIAQTLKEMAVLYEMKGARYKPRTYEKAADSIRSLSEEIAARYEKKGKEALEEISGVGEAIAEHIESLIKTGSFKEYDDLKAEIPVNVNELMRVEDVGPKTIKKLWEELNVKDLEDLEQTAKEDKIKTLKGLGKKTQAKILQSIEFVKSSHGRFILGFIYPDIEDLRTAIAGFKHVNRLEIAGSVRRMKATIGDIDILVTSNEPETIMKQFVDLPQVEHVYGRGETKTNVRLHKGIDADLRVVKDAEWGSALNYFTGSKAHNIKLRKKAQKNGYKLNEYGLFDGDKRIAGNDEKGIYKKLWLKYIEPEMREDRGEIIAAEDGNLPDLIGYGDLKGDLQIQTTWTDGNNTIEEMAKRAIENQLEYIAITDHTQALAMTGGADEAQLEEQMEAINELNERLDDPSFRILTGAEVNIQKDGSLDIANETLKKLDVVGAAIHSHFKLTNKEQMERLKKAMENPHVDIIFHLTGRRIHKRPAINHDIDEVIEIARQTGTVLEVNAYPDRLDINDGYVKKCVENDVKMSISSDAHATSHFDYLKFGIAQARRGWAEKTDIINTLPVDEMLKTLK